MRSKKRPVCGSGMKRNGKTTAAFLSWLLSKETQEGMSGGGRGFRRRTARFWSIWPMPDVVDEVHRVVFVDGIYIARNVVVLIACSEEHVLSWYLARAETTRAWRALPSRIAPPDVVVTDGGSGFAAAVAAEWPRTRVQRCVFHAFQQVKRCTTSRPELQAGVDLHGLAKGLMHLEDLQHARWWIERFMQWCEFWSDFLSEKSVVNGRVECTHERLRKARRGLVALANSGTLFTHLDPVLTAEGPLPATNDRIEGGVNAQLREMLRSHRGMSPMRRIKAVYWWCYMHAECPKGAAELLREMPADADVDLLYELYATNPREVEGPTWGNAPSGRSSITRPLIRIRSTRLQTHILSYKPPLR